MAWAPWPRPVPRSPLRNETILTAVYSDTVHLLPGSIKDTAFGFPGCSPSARRSSGFIARGPKLLAAGPRATYKYHSPGAHRFSAHAHVYKIQLILHIIIITM